MREFLGAGWDCEAWLVDGTWVERTARRPDVEPWLRTETTLLPWLAERLPVTVPVPEIVGIDPLVVRHRLVPGRPLAHVPGTVDEAQLGAVVGTFLRTLHDTPLGEAVACGLPGPERTHGMRAASFARFRDDVLPRLPDDDATHLASRMDLLRDGPPPVLVHGDLSGDHVLVVDGEVVGIIDWGDARAGDPAKDLLWPLHEAGPEVARAAADAYGATDELVERAAAWRDVAPCYAVTHGLDTRDEALVVGTLDLLRARGDGRRTPG